LPISTTADATSPVGGYTITAALGSLASTNYSFSFVNGSLTINTRDLTITATDESKTYGNTFSPNGATQFTTDGNEANGDTVGSVSLNSAGYTDTAGAGSYAIVPTAA